MKKTDAKTLISARLRDPNTDSASFTRLIVLLAKMEGWARTPRKPARTKEEEVNSLVLELERQQRAKGPKGKA